ncbi:MAG: phage virion morphogenesis protein [Deltaproteobacteria bacterium]|nr:phage virion morphogenesis protein [Deltaproteobacteria bacterium]
MAGSMIEVRVDDTELKEILATLQKRMGDMTPFMKTVAQIGRTSVVRNFEKGGRPKWPALKPSTLKKKKGGRVLVTQGFAGGLMGSITGKAYSDRAEIGTNKIYGAVHQFGAKKGSFGKVTVARKAGSAGRSGGTLYSKPWQMNVPWGDIPARPFLVLQDEDIDEIRAEAINYLTE